MREREAFIVEFDHEMAATRRVLERVPDDAFEWTPHERSFSLGGLASHLAQLPHWGSQILEPRCTTWPGRPAGRRPRPRAPKSSRPSTGTSLTSGARSSAGSDAELAAPWTLKRGAHVVLSMPRIAALRRFLLHHVIHHRGQMTVYLRLRDVPVPPLYGPTADERM